MQHVLTIKENDYFIIYDYYLFCKDSNINMCLNFKILKIKHIQQKCMDFLSDVHNENKINIFSLPLKKISPAPLPPVLI